MSNVYVISKLLYIFFWCHCLCPTTMTEPNPTQHATVDTDVSSDEEVFEPIEADENLLDEYDPEAEDLDLLHLKIRSLLALNLTRLPKLKHACFRQNLIQSLDGVQDLPQDLEELDLYDNRITHINHLLKFCGLTQLDLSFNKIKNLKNLDTLVALEKFYICQNKLTRIENIAQFTELTYLELGANRIRKIEGLSTLTNLEQLWLGKNKITKLEGLGALKKLRVLSIQSNRIVKLENLEELEELEEFYISHNGIEKLEGLEKNLKLTTLDVSNNRITSLENLAHLEKLEEFWASGNKFSDFHEVQKELGGLKNLQTVYFEFNPLQLESPVNYVNRLRFALGPSLKQIDANHIRY